MPHDEKPGEGPTAPQGLAGGPGPAPPGVDDGTPPLAVEGAEGPPRGAPGEARRPAGEDGRRAARGDPEEPDPS